MKKRVIRKLALFGLCITPFLMACGKDAKGDESGIGGMSQELDSEGFSPEELDNAPEASGNPFENLTVVDVEDPVYCNLPENMTIWESRIPICRDPLYDILYYADWGGDHMIHMVKDGEEKIAVPFMGKRLFCRGGKLYFLMDRFRQPAVEGMKNGNILSYDPISGEIEIVSDAVFDSIVVYQDMIFCRTVEENRSGREVAYYSYSFDTKELIEKEKEPLMTYLLGIHRHGEYFLSGVMEQIDISSVEDEVIKEQFQNYLDGGGSPEGIRGETSIMLCRWGGVDRIPLDGLSLQTSWRHYVKGDDVYWFTSEDGLLHTYHIPTQQEKTSSIGYEGGEALLVGDILYTSGRYYGYYTNLKNGIQEKCFIMGPHGDGAILNELFVDGESVYGLATVADVLGIYRIQYSSQEEAAPIVQSYWAEDLASCQHVFMLLPVDMDWK